MRSVNKVFLYGNLGADPEVRSTPTGTDVAQFSLATNRSVRIDEGFRNETDWHTVVAFDWLARRASERLKKGHPVAVVGSLRPKTWKDAEGNSRKRVEIYAENLCFSPMASNEPNSLSSKGDRSPNEALPERAEVPF
ncbi:MAG: single-stranded DNA-binding protein [Myxococcota bacterium]|jgi:single-strand DNA-binding protein|nr:single-stranded DNA-binding protein [Myxococcota bacterium]